MEIITIKDLNCLHNRPHVSKTALYGGTIFILSTLSLETLLTFDLYLSGKGLLSTHAPFQHRIASHSVS